MNTVLARLILILLILPLTIAAREAESTRSFQVTVDPRVELMCIVFRLAGNPEYSKARVKSYARDVEEQFGSFRDHEVVQMARELRRTRGVSYDAVMSYAIHLTPDLEPAKPFSPLPGTLDSRWRARDAEEFLEKLRRFARASDFSSFFDAHQALYQPAIERMTEVAEKEGDFGWFDRFFGAKPGARFTVVLGLLNGGGSYGVKLQDDGGAEDLYCILGVWATDWQGRPKFTADMLRTVAHEFCHSYVNPVVYANEDKLSRAGRKMYSWVAEEMQQQAYGSWTTMIHESLVRASVVRYVLATSGEDAAKQQADHEVRRHFRWTPELAALLAEYEADRDKYPEYESFFPRVIEFFDDYAPKFDSEMTQKQGNAPKIVSIVPENGSTTVDPDLKEIVIKFDRPMHAGYSFVGGGPKYPETVGKPVFSEDFKTITLKVKLKPNWDYEFWLNSRKYTSFRSRQGVPLKPLHVEFKTAR